MDWRSLVIVSRFVREAHARRGELPSDDEIEGTADAPRFLHIVAAFHEPRIAETLEALLRSKYPRQRLHFVVVTKQEEELSPHPDMESDTAALVRRFREALPPEDQARITHLAMPQSDPGPRSHSWDKARQLNWALRAQVLDEIFGHGIDHKSVFIGVSDADSVPDPDTFRWIAWRQMTGRANPAYQGVPLAVANFARLPTRGRIYGIQQSSTFIRVCLARLLNEAKRAALCDRLASSAPRMYRLFRPFLDSLFRRSHIFLGHNQFVRLDVLESAGGFPVMTCTEDATLGYALSRVGVRIEAAPMVELIEVPETKEKIVRQNARWYRGIIYDVQFLWTVWRERPTAYNLVQFLRHTVLKALEWPIALPLYTASGWGVWVLSSYYRNHALLYYSARAIPLLSLVLTFWAAGIVPNSIIRGMQPCLCRPLDLRMRGAGEWLFGTIRCQAYSFLAARGCWRVLWALLRTGRYDPAKTDRVAFGRTPDLGALRSPSIVSSPARTA